MAPRITTTTMDLSHSATRYSTNLAEDVSPSESEAWQELLLLAGRKTMPIPPELIVQHIVEVTRGMDWPVKRVALEAVLSRCAKAKRDGLSVAARPGRRKRLGLYKTGKPGVSTQPYNLMLWGIEPFHGSCDCPDFLRNSLGICKHLLAVLIDIYGQSSFIKQALKEQNETAEPTCPGLRWTAIRAALGEGDWLESVSWHGRLQECPASLGFSVRRLFQKDPAGTLSLKTTCADDIKRRRILVRDLLKLQQSSAALQSPPFSLPDPALREMLLEETKKLDLRLKTGKALAGLRRSLGRLKYKLYPYQIEGVERFLESGRLLLADDMGLGKTVQSIAICQALWDAGLVKRGLFITPASLKPQWLREWQSCCSLPVTVVEGRPEEREAIYDGTRRGFLIANYEQILKDLEIMHSWAPDLVVLDEAQRIKNWSTKTALYTKQLKPAYRLVLTGTPMENRVGELSSVVEWVDSYALEPTWRLIPWHSVYTDDTKVVSGARNLDTLRVRLETCCLRRVRQDVLKQLPARTDTRVPIKMTEAQVEAHEELRLPIARLMANARKRPLTQAEFLRLMLLFATQRIISNGLEQLNFDEVWPELSRIPQPSEDILRNLNAPKLLELRQIIAQLVLEQHRKVVIFSQWRHMLILAHWAIAGLLAPAGLRAVYFTGQEGQKRRTQNLVDFHDDPDVPVFLATDAGGVGLNLQRAANCCINLELPWNPAVLEQRVGRIYRIGQKRPIDIYNLVCEFGIEARIWALIGSKRALFTGLFDGASDQVSFEQSGNFLSGLEKLVEPISVPKLNKTSDCKEDRQEEGEEEDSAAAEDLSHVGGDETSAAFASDATSIQTAAQAAILSPDILQIKQLFSQVDASTDSTGRINFRASPEVAAKLADVFEGMAALFRIVAG